MTRRSVDHPKKKIPAPSAGSQNRKHRKRPLPQEVRNAEAAAGFERARKRLLDQCKLEAWEEGFRQQFAENRTDVQARGIVHRFIDEGAPFVLYLRNFAQEAYDVIKLETPNDPDRRRFGVLGSSSVENGLSRTFQHLPVLAIANPRDVMMSGVRFPRLELFGGRWTEAIDGLVRAASFIVFVLEAEAPGVSKELRAVSQHHRQNATVIVIVRESHDLARPLLEAMGAKSPTHGPIGRDNELFAGFPRIVAQDEIGEEAQRSAVFADLLVEFDARTRGPDTLDVIRDRAFLGNAWGLYWLSAAGEQELTRHECIDEAMRVLSKALNLYAKIRDIAGMATTLINIGRAYLFAEQYADAIAAFRDSGTYFRSRLHDERNFGEAVVWVALAYHQSGDPKTALGYLFNLLESEKENETGVAVDALDLMARIYRDLGDDESARNCLVDLRTARRRAARREASPRVLPSKSS